MAEEITKIVIDGDSRGAEGAFKRVQLGAENFGRSVKNVSGIVGRFLPLLGAASVTAFGKNIIDSADAMQKIAVRTGVSIERVAAFNQAAELSGVSLEKLTEALDKSGRYLVENSEELKKLGIEASTSEEVIFQLADVISSLDADDPQRVAIAMQVLGKSAGELLPLLSQGGDALREMADRGARAAAVMKELGPASEEFNDNLTKLQQNAGIIGAEVFLPLVKGANSLADSLVRTSKEQGNFLAAAKGLSFLTLQGQTVFLLDQLFGNVAENTEQATKNTREQTQETTKLERQLRLLNLQLIQQQNALAKTQSGQVADAYKQNIDSLKEQIKGFEDLQKAMTDAFAEAGSAAADAMTKADQFLDRASRIRQSAADRVTDLELKGVPDAEADAVRNQQILDALEAAKSARIKADYQRLIGNTAEAERQLGLAEDQAQRADDISGKLNDEALARQSILDAAEALARIDESRATVQQAIAKQEAERQSSLSELMKENAERSADLESRLSQLTDRLKELASTETNIKITTDQGAIDQTLAKLGKVQSALDQIRRGAAVVVGAGQVTGPAEGYATGGIVRGPGTGTSDSILARLSNGEFVMRRDAVLRYGLRHLEEMNRLRAPRYADGGLVASSATRVFSLPNLPERKASGPMTTVNIHLPGGASFPMQATPDIGTALQKALAMESLKNGSPR